MSDLASTAAEKVPPTPATPHIPIPATRHGNPLISVLLNEAGLDSPTFRSNALHFADQVDAIERWLEGYSRVTSKLSHDMLGLEAVVNDYLSKIVPPQHVVSLDHDYTALALKRISEGSREWWTHILGVARKMDNMSAEPIRNFLQNDLRNFKETRRNLDQAQRTFDTTLARYLGQSKAKEPSAIREDAFAVYETRKSYLKAAMDFCQMAPQLRFTLDKLLVRVSSDIWREMKRSKDTAGSFGNWGQQMDRVRGWSKEMELTESSFKRELQAARREVGESSLVSFKPSRELDAYSASTVPFLGAKGPLNVNTDEKAGVYSEKQGWLFLRTVTGKPVRTNWIRRWYYCRDGIFGWLVSGSQGVLTGDEIGVLLCNAKPAVSEERRFCFEVKTKNQTLLLQAETQSELMGWLEVFEVAKKKAFEASVGRDTSSLPGGVDPAFAITPPSMPEFSAKSLDAQLGADEPVQERTNTLPVPGQETGGLIPRASFDVTTVAPRRSATSLGREEGESGRDHAARIMQKLDLHRKANYSSTTDVSAGMSTPGPSGGIASLISASHGLLPGYPAPIVGQVVPRPSQQAQPVTLSGPEPHAGSLGPSTLASPPAPTSLSRTAVVYSSDRSLGSDTGPGLPTAILANYWGSNAWAQEYAPKVIKTDFNPDDPFGPNSPSIKMTMAGEGGELQAPSPSHKKAISMDAKIVHPRAVAEKSVQEQFPAGYPLELKTNTAQFRLVFPTVPLDEKIVLVFRASWTTSMSERSKDSLGMTGNGRIYVTPDNMYFYGHQMGLVVAYAISLDSITEVTAAPGRDCDFIFLHLSQDTPESRYSRISIKTFLEDVDLLHSRLNLLVDDLQAEEPMEVMDLIKTLVNIESEEQEKRSPSVESWEEISANTPADNNTLAGRAVSPRAGFAYNARSRGAARKAVPKLQLPAHAVHYEPEDMQRKVAERTFEISAKACFHVLFGDKSFVFPKLYFERRAKQIAQGPWTVGESGRLQRLFQFKVKYGTMFRQSRTEDITDQQTIEVFSDHVTYVVTHVKTPWHLPHAGDFKLVTKIVITHLAKSKCKLAIFTKVAWSKAPTLAKNMVERQALDDADIDAEELAEVATDQVRKIGPHSRTKRAIQIYGNIGQQGQVVLFSPAETERIRKTHIRPHSLTSMLLDIVRSFMESAVTSVIMWAVAAVKKIWHVITAERLLLAVLAFSTLFNIVLTSQGASTWWGDRKAAGFMHRLGVGPNVMMSKAIYLRDLDEAARFSSLDSSWPAEGSYCYSTFQSIANSTDIDAPFEDSGASLSSATSRATARRLRRSRQRLGAYRHDLLVSMRMVNSVEREMLQGEWENWLLDENSRCDQVGGVLRAWNSTSSSSAKPEKGAVDLESEAAQKILKEKDDRKQEALKSWYQDYCGSCRQDKEQLVQNRERLSLA